MKYLKRALLLLSINCLTYSMEEPPTNNIYSGVIFDRNKFDDVQSFIQYLSEPLAFLSEQPELTQFQSETTQEMVLKGFEGILFTSNDAPEVEPSEEQSAGIIPITLGLRIDDDAQSQCAWQHCKHITLHREKEVHLYSHLSYICRLCKRPYLRIRGLKKHLQNTHSIKEAREKRLSHWFEKHIQAIPSIKKFLQKYFFILKKDCRDQIIERYELEPDRALQPLQLLQLRYIKPTMEGSWKNLIAKLDYTNHFSVQLLFNDSGTREEQSQEDREPIPTHHRVQTIECYQQVAPSYEAAQAITTPIFDQPQRSAGIIPITLGLRVNRDSQSQCAWQHCKHITLHRRKEEHLYSHLSYTCRLCKGSYLRSRGLKTHLQNTHSIKEARGKKLSHWFVKHITATESIENFLQKYLFIFKIECRDQIIEDYKLERSKALQPSQLLQLKFVTPAMEGSWKNLITKLANNFHDHPSSSPLVHLDQQFSSKSSKLSPPNFDMELITSGQEVEPDVASIVSPEIPDKNIVQLIDFLMPKIFDEKFSEWVELVYKIEDNNDSLQKNIEEAELTKNESQQNPSQPIAYTLNEPELPKNIEREPEILGRKIELLKPSKQPHKKPKRRRKRAKFPTQVIQVEQSTVSTSQPPSENDEPIQEVPQPAECLAADESPHFSYEELKNALIQ